MNRLLESHNVQINELSLKANQDMETLEQKLKLKFDEELQKINEQQELYKSSSDEETDRNKAKIMEKTQQIKKLEEDLEEKQKEIERKNDAYDNRDHEIS